jgi:D-aminoacyl-tRNA deacylase
MKAIVYSSKDTGGSNIAARLRERGFEQTDMIWEQNTVFRKGDWLLVETQSEIVFCDIVNGLDVDEIIFASRHKSASAKPTLTVHPSGNFGKAEHGGKDGWINPTSAGRMKLVMLEIVRQSKAAELQGYEISAEVTHHGPTIEIPSCFVELGSSEKQWADEKAADVLAAAIDAALEKKFDGKVGIGFGGSHYAPTFSDVMKRGDIAVSHMMAKYAMGSLSEGTVRQMLEKTVEKADFAVLDWKGLLADERQKVAKIAEKLGLIVSKTSDLF